MKGESPLQQLLYNVGKAVSGVRWVITTENVHLVAERLFHATPEDDSLWVIWATCPVDQATKEA